MKTRLLYFFLLLLAFIAVANTVFGEALSELWKDDLLTIFHRDKWLMLVFVLMLALVGILLAFLTERKKTAVPEKVDAERYDEAFGKFKKLLLEQYQLRLQAKIAKRLPINLSAKSTDFGMNPERARAFAPSQTIESEDIASEIDKILRTHDRLLLIGDPGAGKTTVLLFAALNILQTEQGQADKLPLILNLATWDKKRDFGEWYAQNIAHTYSLSPVFVKGLLEQNAVVPFFDGFDEITEDARDDCFQKMRAWFGDARHRQLIVSSRKKEYAAAEEDAPVFAEIEVLPLSLAQIKKALSENAGAQAGEHGLLDALERDQYLAQAVETPFYLNTASFLFGNKLRTLADFNFRAASTKGRRKELLRFFVDEQVPDKQDKKYLSFLAGNMNEERFLVFELLWLRPLWCGKKWKYVLSNTLVIGLAFGFSIALVIGLVFNTYKGFVPGLLCGFIVGLICGLIGEIYLIAIQKWSWGEIKKYWSHQLGFVLFGSLFVGLVFVWVTKVFFGLTFSLGGGWVFGLVFCLVEGLKDAGTTTHILLYSPLYPYQRFTSTFWIDFWRTLVSIIALLAGTFFSQMWEGTFSRNLLLHSVDDMDYWLKIILFGLLLLLPPLVSSQLLQHFSLRLVLYREGKMPLRVVRFMDRMSEQHIFEDNRRTVKGKKQRGATWRFRHKILQDYFAGRGYRIDNFLKVVNSAKSRR